MTEKLETARDTIKTDPHGAKQEWQTLTCDLSPEERRLACDLLDEVLAYRQRLESRGVWSCPSKGVVCADVRKTTPVLAA